MTRVLARILLVLMLALAAGSAHAQAAGRILVTPVKGAPEPFDATIARKVAEELLRIGYQAGTGGDEPVVVTLKGVAKARKSAAGAVFTVAWTMFDRAGAPMGGFTSEATAPYDAQDPWDAFDADTLNAFAKRIALDAEKAMKSPAAAKAKDPGAGKKAASAAAVTPGITNVFIKGVTGAPGDGNVALANALAQFFARFDIELLPSAAVNAYFIEARVAVTAASPKEDRVQILWLLKSGTGKELARVEQDNKVPSGSVAGAWGPAAIYAAQGAADGLISVMTRLGAQPPR